MKITKPSISLTVAAGLLMSLASGNAATIFSDAKGVAENGFVASSPDLRVGRGGAGARFATFAAFSVQDILSDTGLTQGDLATTDFNVSFDTTNSILLSNPGTYTASYRGFFANADLSPNSFWTSLRGSFDGSSGLDTGVADTLANQIGITSPLFNLTGITESDTANDYVVVGIGYSSQQPEQVREIIGNITLNAILPPAAIPEPSVALLTGLGLLALLRRRRA